MLVPPWLAGEARGVIPSTIIVAALIIGLVAGCITPAASDLKTPPGGARSGAAFVPPAPPFDFSKVVNTEDEHSAAALHTAGHGLDLTGFAAIRSLLPPTTRGSITQIDLWKNYAVVSGMEGGLAFAIVDITDAADPKAVSYFPSAADGWTARFSADGNYIFYGCQMLGATGYAVSNVVGTCKDPMAPHTPTDNAGGLVAVDVKDKAHPKFVDFLPGVNAHNVFAANVSGVDTIVTNGVDIITFDRAAGKLSAVAKVPGRHDATLHRHPITGDWLLFTGTNELSIYRLNDPAHPEPVYVPETSQASKYVGWHEQTLIPGVVDGRVILALAGETGVQPMANAPLDKVTFMDVTDPARPIVTGTWSPPFHPLAPWASYTFSAHEMAATPSGQVAISWYHAGVWVVDVSTKERQASPVTLAAYQPHNDIDVVPSTFAQTPFPLVPFVWGAGWDARGYLVIPDMHTGVYTLKPDWGLHPTGMAGGGQ